MLSAKNIMDHNSFWPELPFEGFLCIDTPLNMLRQHAKDIEKKIFESVDNDELTKLFENSKSKSVCLLYLPVATLININKFPIPTRLNMFYLIKFANPDFATLQVANQLNDQLQAMS